MAKPVLGIVVLLILAVALAAAYFLFLQPVPSVSQTLQAQGIDENEFNNSVSSFSQPLDETKLENARQAFESQKTPQADFMVKVLDLKERQNKVLDSFAAFMQLSFYDQCDQVEEKFSSMNEETSQIVADAKKLNEEAASAKMDSPINVENLQSGFDSLYDTLDRAWNQCLLLQYDGGGL